MVAERQQGADEALGRRGALERNRERLAAFRAMMRQNPNMAFGLAIIALAALMAVFAPLITRVDPQALDPVNRLQAPSAAAFFGTDSVGRDVFSRTIYGSRLSLAIGLCVTLATIVSGVAIGIVAGYNKLADNIIMRFMDGLMAFPSFLLAIALVALLGASFQNVVIALSVVETPRVARIVRGSVLSLRERQYVEGGARGWRAAAADIGVSHISESRRAADGSGDVCVRAGDTGGGGAELFGRGRAAVHTELGEYDGGGEAVYAAGGLDDILPGAVLVADGAGGEFGGGWAAGYAGSAVAADGVRRGER